MEGHGKGLLMGRAFFCGVMREAVSVIVVTAESSVNMLSSV